MYVCVCVCVYAYIYMCIQNQLKQKTICGDYTIVLLYRQIRETIFIDIDIDINFDVDINIYIYIYHDDCVQCGRANAKDKC